MHTLPQPEQEMLTLVSVPAHSRLKRELMKRLPHLVSDQEWADFLSWKEHRNERLNLSCIWTYKETKNGILVRERKVKNVFTNYGLTALASALNGGYIPPLYLVIEANGATVTSASAGSSSFSLPSRVDQVGDTQLIVGAGQANVETVTFTSVTGSGPYTYTLSAPLVNSHFSVIVCRNVLVSDMMSNVSNEQQYDSTNYHNLRMPSPGGYSAGNGNWTVQFYFPGSSANVLFTTVGLSDSPTVGLGNLHNHFVLGIGHVSGTNDIEIDGSLTLSNI